jgi:hypothetical protein
MAELRRCIGSKRFGIEPHEAPIKDFPKQPSQKDGLGRMCKPHWNQYTAGLARDAKARKVLGDAATGSPAKAERVDRQAKGTKTPTRAPRRKPEKAPSAVSRRRARPVAEDASAVAEVATEA